MTLTLRPRSHEQVKGHQRAGGSTENHVLCKGRLGIHRESLQFNKATLLLKLATFFREELFFKAGLQKAKKTKQNPNKQKTLEVGNHE